MTDEVNPIDEGPIVVRDMILGLFFLIFLDSLGMSSQIDEAESMMVDLLEAEAAFPTRYAVECVLEAQIPSPEGLTTWYSQQWFARDAKMGLISVVAEQELQLDFVAKEHKRVVMWMKGSEAWSYSGFDSWVSDGDTLLPIFDPKHALVSSLDIVESSLHENSLARSLSNRECVPALATKPSASSIFTPWVAKVVKTFGRRCTTPKVLSVLI